MSDALTFFADMDISVSSSITLYRREDTEILSFWFIYCPSYKGERRRLKDYLVVTGDFNPLYIGENLVVVELG